MNRFVKWWLGIDEFSQTRKEIAERLSYEVTDVLNRDQTQPWHIKRLVAHRKNILSKADDDILYIIDKLVKEVNTHNARL